MGILLPLNTALNDGTPIVIREIGPDDRCLLQEGFAQLSEQSRFNRFLAPHPRLTDAELDLFTRPGDLSHFAIGAVGGPRDAPVPLASARFVGLPDDPKRAEIALTVVDRHHRKGLGRRLLLLLGEEARPRGIEAFTALVHRDNLAVQSLFRTLGGQPIDRATPEVEWLLPLPLQDLQRPVAA